MVAEKPERPVRLAPLVPAPLGQPEVVAEAALRSEVVGSPSYCSEDAAKRQGSVLIPMPGWGSWELIQGQVNANSTTSDVVSNHGLSVNGAVVVCLNASVRRAVVNTIAKFSRRKHFFQPPLSPLCTRFALQLLLVDRKCRVSLSLSLSKVRKSRDHGAFSPLHATNRAWDFRSLIVERLR